MTALHFNFATMEEEKRIIIPTNDGSHTIQLAASGVMYHSKHGAMQESSWIYLNYGFVTVLQQFSGEAISVFEMGFGSGLNAFLTALEAQKAELGVIYTTYELFPLSQAESSLLNYPSTEEEGIVFKNIHDAAWEKVIRVNPFFSINKKKKNVLELNEPQQFHLIYFDAFAPEHQPELWTSAVFQQLYDILLPGGILVTYCSKSEVRRNMQAAGFVVKKVPGPYGKREILQAMRPG